MAGVRANLTLALLGAYFGSNDRGLPEFELNISAKNAFTEGALANQADKIFVDDRTLAGSATEDLDLTGSALQDPFGKNLNMASVKAIVVIADAANVNDVVVGGQTVNGFLGPFNSAAHKVRVPAGGMFAITAPSAGWPVVASTGDLLTIGNGGSGTSVNYTVVIIGNA